MEICLIIFHAPSVHPCLWRLSPVTPHYHNPSTSPFHHLPTHYSPSCIRTLITITTFALFPAFLPYTSSTPISPSPIHFPMPPITITPVTFITINHCKSNTSVSICLHSKVSWRWKRLPVSRGRSARTGWRRREAQRRQRWPPLRKRYSDLLCICVIYKKKGKKILWNNYWQEMFSITIALSAEKLWMMCGIFKLFSWGVLKCLCHCILEHNAKEMWWLLCVFVTIPSTR